MNSRKVAGLLTGCWLGLVLLAAVQGDELQRASDAAPTMTASEDLGQMSKG